MISRAQETKIVKAALKAAGFDKENEIRVTHGHGTGWGWLDVSATIAHDPDCTCFIHPWGVRKTGESCKIKWRKIHNALRDIAMRATGRHGDYDGRIGIHLNFRGDTGHDHD